MIWRCKDNAFFRMNQINCKLIAIELEKSDLSESLIEVGNDVVDVLDTD